LEFGFSRPAAVHDDQEQTEHKSGLRTLLDRVLGKMDSQKKGKGSLGTLSNKIKSNLNFLIFGVSVLGMAQIVCFPIFCQSVDPQPPHPYPEIGDVGWHKI
jgi:hypothetical protein